MHIEEKENFAIISMFYTCAFCVIIFQPTENLELNGLMLLVPFSAILLLFVVDFRTHKKIMKTAWKFLNASVLGGLITFIVYLIWGSGNIG